VRKLESAFFMDPLVNPRYCDHLHEAGVDSHLAPHLNTPEGDLTLGNHVANDALRPQSRASAPTATRDSTIVKRSLIAVAALTVCGVILAQTNENLVRVQNRLKAEGLYFGDPTGVLDAQTKTALALYQIDHHLTVTGQLDAPTARELDASPQTPMFTPTPRQSPTPTGTPSATATPTPRATPSVTPTPTPTSIASPPPNVEQPPPMNPDSLRDYVEAFVQAGLARPVGSELKFFAERVDYFGAPNVARQRIKRDLVRYNRKWPHRRFWIDGDVQVERQSGNEIKLLFPLRYELRNGSRHASGKVLKSLTLVKTADNEMQIVAVNESKAP
jgi:peptidoglycan hydrolase-like protein with peptidoglycan-binding domain